MSFGCICPLSRMVVELGSLDRPFVHLSPSISTFPAASRKWQCRDRHLNGSGSSMTIKRRVISHSLSNISRSEMAEGLTALRRAAGLWRREWCDLPTRASLPNGPIARGTSDPTWSRESRRGYGSAILACASRAPDQAHWLAQRRQVHVRSPGLSNIGQDGPLA